MNGWMDREMDGGWAFGVGVGVGVWLSGTGSVPRRTPPSLDTFTNSTSHGQATRHAEDCKARYSSRYRHRYRCVVC